MNAGNDLTRDVFGPLSYEFPPTEPDCSDGNQPRARHTQRRLDRAEASGDRRNTSSSVSAFSNSGR
eukprot:12895249-Prorocentrum_lima.AAC.1